MNSLLRKPTTPLSVIILACCFLVLIIGVIAAGRVHASTQMPANGERLITVHDGDQERGILTHATTLRQAFQEASIRFDDKDLVEPGIDDQLVASSYEVNIYRARPVTIVDGVVQKKILSAYRTAEQIIGQAGMKLHDEDSTRIQAPSNIVSEGTGLRLVITRATPFTLVLYGKKTTSYSQSATVGEMLEEKGITIGEQDTLSVKQDVTLRSGMTVELWRNGKQTVTEVKPIAYAIEQIQDVDREIGYKDIKTPGIKGKRTVTYEIEMKNGKEVSRKEIQSVVTKKPTAQVEVVGAKVSLPAGSHEDWMASGGIAQGDYGYVNYIFTNESGWNPAARNPVGYVGLGQTREANLSSSCSNWQSDPICQIRFFNGYAVSRYGSWSGAYDFKASHGWW